MMRRANSTLAGLLCLISLVSATASAEQSAQQWLTRMADAMRSMNYEGTFVYRHNGDMEAMHLVHRRQGDSERERLRSLDGVAREIIRDDDRVTCILPDRRSVMVDRRYSRNPLSLLTPNDPDRLNKAYTLSTGGVQRIADRDARRISIRPRDNLRYGYELWIDAEYGVLLRSDLLDRSGEPVEQVVFIEIAFPDEIPDEWLQPTISGKEFSWFETSAGETAGQGSATGDESDWTVDSLPVGFEQVFRESRMVPGAKAAVEHRMFSDGLASVSVYIGDTDANSGHLSGHSGMGAMNAFGIVVSDHQVVVVGEVPAATAERIARSVTQVDGGSDR